MLFIIISNIELVDAEHIPKETFDAINKAHFLFQAEVQKVLLLYAPRSMSMQAHVDGHYVCSQFPLGVFEPKHFSLPSDSCIVLLSYDYMNDVLRNDGSLG